MKRTQKQKRRQHTQKQKRRQIVMIGLVAVGASLILAGILMTRRDDPVASAGDLSDQQFIAQGKEVYDTYCAACHGFDLEGQPEWQQPFPDGSFKAPPHDETGHTWHHSDAYLIESIQLGGERLAPNIGVSLMPAYADLLTDQQILAVLAYIKSTWPPEILEAQSRR